MATSIRGGDRRIPQYHHHHSSTSSFAPPPSPIPTGGGNRSAAANDNVLDEYFNKNLQIPRLHLPPDTQTTTSHPYHRPRIPEQIDLRLLASGVGNSIDRLLRSAKDFGAFRISGHGLSRDELASVKAVVEIFFRRLDDRKNRFRRSFVERIGNREEFVWFRSDKAMTLWAREVMGPDKYRDFSYKMESVVSKLDGIAEELAEILSKDAVKRFEKVIQERESIISLFRYNDSSPSLLVSNEDIHESTEHCFSLHLAMERGEFYAHTQKGPLSFGIDPDTIVVTIGDQLVEWSGREFSNVKGEVIFDPDLHGTEASYSLELKCSPLNLNFGYRKKNGKKISIVDQLLFALVLTFLFHALFYFVYHESKRYISIF